MAPRRKSVPSPKAFLAKTGVAGTPKKYAKEAVIFSQGDDCDCLYFIQKGKVKMTVVSDLGKEAVVAILGANDFIGEACLTGASVRVSSAAALTETIALRLDKNAVTSLLRKDVVFADFFMQHLLMRNTRVEADLVDQLFNASEKRLARTLLLLANFGTDAKPESIMAKISQETLAEMIGTTRSRVSFFMNKFRKLGFIRYNGGIQVNRSLLNAVLHDKPKIKP